MQNVTRVDALARGLEPLKEETRNAEAISYSRNPPVENGPFRLDFFSTGFFCGPSSYRQSSRFHSFCALPRGGWCEGVLLYGARKSVHSSVLGAFFASDACFTRDEPSSKRVGGVGLGRKPPKATAGVAVVGKTASITRATTAVVYTLLASGARSAPR